MGVSPPHRTSLQLLHRTSGAYLLAHRPQEPAVRRATSGGSKTYEYGRTANGSYPGKADSAARLPSPHSQISSTTYS
jgi:hypothetical protein